jgi:phosphatidylserine/phosphatidylglycerophosphate/cardiolipin synthase-like enzyme
MPRDDQSLSPPAAPFPDIRRPRPAIVEEGRNCWRLVRAAQASLLTNADYFQRLAAALEQARDRILLVGWDLDAALVLDPRRDGPAALPFAQFLAALMQARPSLDIRFLLWDRTIFYGGNWRSAAALDALAAAHPRFRHHFASAPFACSHHAKLVVIDDSLAFVGGIDLAGDRWDPVDHPPSHPDRVTPAGEVYGPVHDLQMAVTGQAAGALADHALAHWAAETGEVLKPLAWMPDAWPAGLPVDFTDVPAAIARTEPGAAHEVEQLNHDALAAARDCIYLEAQYLTSEAVGDQLARRLEAWDGPEIVIIVTRTSHGHLEQFAMGNNRDRLLRRLRAADRWNRLRVYYPTVADGSGQVEVKVHAKLVVIDDRLLRVGSSNLNNRSMAVDTECDLAIEAVTPAHRDRIRMIRNRLVAEQLCCPVDAVAAAWHRHRSLIAVIEELNTAGRLQPLEVSEDGPCEPMPGTSVLDPTRPLSFDILWSALGPDGMEPLAQFDPGKQRAAGGERH